MWWLIYCTKLLEGDLFDNISLWPVNVAVTVFQRCPWRRGSARFWKKIIAAAFFSRTLKNCMNLVEFQGLQMKHPETKWIWWTSTNISGPIQSQQWNSKNFFKNHSGSGAVTFFNKRSRRGRFSTAMDISAVFSSKNRFLCTEFRKKVLMWEDCCLIWLRYFTCRLFFAKNEFYEKEKSVYINRWHW